MWSASVLRYGYSIVLTTLLNLPHAPNTALKANAVILQSFYFMSRRLAAVWLLIICIEMLLTPVKVNCAETGQWQVARITFKHRGPVERSRGTRTRRSSSKCFSSSKPTALSHPLTKFTAVFSTWHHNSVRLSPDLCACPPLTKTMWAHLNSATSKLLHFSIQFDFGLKCFQVFVSLLPSDSPLSVGRSSNRGTRVSRSGPSAWDAALRARFILSSFLSRGGVDAPSVLADQRCAPFLGVSRLSR